MLNPLVRFSKDLGEASAQETKPRQALAAGIAYLRFSASVAVVGQAKNLAPVQVWTGISRVRQLVS